MPLTPDRVLLTDRVAVVTGAAVGIGRAIALAFAHFGADLALCDRDAEQLGDVADQARKLDRKVVTGVLDVRDAQQVDGFVAESVGELGRVDVLVNNAGGGFLAEFLEVSGKGQDALVRENFTSVTNFVRACVPHIPDTGGSIVNLTSIEAHRAAPGFAIYAAMKTAVLSLTKSLALELGPRLVRVNCIAPDVIPTPGIGDDFGVRTPLPVRGDVDDCAGAAVFLASDLSRFVTGTTIHVDGGNLAAAGWVRQTDGSYGTGV
ncbi:MAG: 3-oxoacyl-[acyl-carrier protein] reductase [Actinomycetota bacterium]|nr:3-oxoacyl-[acyl-carrier protein] reductase [Actinomycetota bacterium]